VTDGDLCWILRSRKCIEFQSEHVSIELPARFDHSNYRKCSDGSFGNPAALRALCFRKKLLLPLNKLRFRVVPGQVALSTVLQGKQSFIHGKVCSTHLILLDK